MSADSLSRPWFCSDMELAVDKLDYRIDEGAVLLEVDTLRFGRGRAARFTLRPFVWNRSTQGYVRPAGTRTYRLDPRFGSEHRMHRIDWAAWTDGGGLRIDSLSIPRRKSKVTRIVRCPGRNV